MEGKVDRRLYILAGFALVAIVVVGAILISRSGGDDGDSTSASGDSTTASSDSSSGCKEVEAPEPKKVQLDAPEEGSVVEKGDEATVVMETSCGTFEIALDTERAPITANSFAYLAEEGFYDDTTFHRVVPGFVIQGGDPLGTGVGGPGYSVDEKPPPSLSYTKGLVAMAKSSADPPGRSASQFYVVTAPDAGLPPEYALVGKVTKGYDAVERIEKLGGPEEKPKQTVLIEQATVEKG
ncbi:MAG TPA: peptidylprolyl isomerase [Solirubrobacterales bacterium]